MRPSLEDRPLVVLSNNDGCAIARTQEAKTLGIKMGAPWFKIKHLAQTHGLLALSANFNLYGDLSQRMMSVIGQFSPQQEIYSIDESFLDLTGVPGTGRELGSAIRQRVKQWVGISTCVGIGPSKTLAKLVNHLAKKVARLQGVCDLSTLDNAGRLRALRHVPIEDVWGVGRRLAPQLRELGICTASDLAQQSPQRIQERFSVVLAKTVRELVGESYIGWEDEPADKQQIMCSRSFGKPVADLIDLHQALAVFVSRAAEKLRSQASLTEAIHVFILTSPFREGPKYTGSTIVKVAPTDDTAALIGAVSQALRQIFRPGYVYAKAGVCLLEIEQRAQVESQLGLFDPQEPTYEIPKTDLMQIMDQLNQRFGRFTVVAGDALEQGDAPWQMRQERKTPAYTTCWDDIVEIWR